MATFAVVLNNIVSNVIVADTKEIAEQITGFSCIEYTQENPAGIGWVYDLETDSFISPEVNDANI